MNKATVSLLALALGAAPALAGWDEGTAAFRARNYSQAAQEFSAYVQQSPESFQGHYMLGLSLDQLGRKEEALHHLRQAYDLNPNDLDVKLALGKAYRAVRRFSEVDKLLSSVDAGTIGDTNKRAALYQMRIEARMKANNQDGAARDIEALARLRPNDPAVQQLLASTALSSGDTGKAVEAFAKAASQPGADAQTKRNYLNALLKHARETRDRNVKLQTYARAAQVAAQLAGSNPTYDLLILQTGAELGAKKYDDAARTAAKAIAKNSRDWLAYFYAGQAYSSGGRVGDAEAPLRQALALAGEDDKRRVWEQLGFIYEKQKDYAKAVDAYNRAGKPDAVARVQRNQETAQYNEQVEAENERIRAMEAEARALEEALEELEGGDGL